MSDAQGELVRVAEFLGAPVAATFRGDAKGGFPEDNDLYVFSPGNVGSLVANRLATEADVILAVGTTFSDETTSSYSPGVTFNIPPTKLIHMDIDPREIGKTTRRKSASIPMQRRVSLPCTTFCRRWERKQIITGPPTTSG